MRPKFDPDLLLSNLLLYLIFADYIAAVYTLTLSVLMGLEIGLVNDKSIIFSPPWWVNVIVIGIVLITFMPLRRWLQSRINVLIYGEHDDPYTLISQVNQQLQQMVSPQMTLLGLVELIARTLKLPYVRIETLHRDSPHKVEYGVHLQPLELTSLPLSYLDKITGELHVSARRTNETLSNSDLNLLRDVARQVGVALYAADLTDDLQRARERLVLSREEERRRLRNDLHDDLAPTLASLALTAITAADLIPANPSAATALMKELHTEIRATVANIRRLVYELRPPTLDELGLLVAVCERAAQYSNAPDGFRVTVDAPAELPALPAAVEVAAYRIAQEALENVARHSHARHCTIRLLIHDAFEIQITDDGTGLPPGIAPGVGLRSMCERAAELGGDCEIQRGANCGTRVLARLPIG